jgi:hypothetical protein
MLQGNYGRAVDLTHPKVVRYFGGREKMIAVFKSGTDSIKAETGLAAVSARAESPLGFWAGGSDLYTLVPVTEEGKLREGRLIWKTHYIGISSDQGKTWFFVNSLAFQDGDPRAFFPNWPAALKLPPRERPRLETESSRPTI